jgi:multiple sugar transport system substrate-binding protein
LRQSHKEVIAEPGLLRGLEVQHRQRDVYRIADRNSTRVLMEVETMSRINWGFVTAVALVIMLTLVGSGFASTYDLGGATVTIVSWDGPLSGSFEEGGRAPGLVEEAEKLFNCKIEFLAFPHGSYPDSYMTRLLSGDSKYDIWLMQEGHFWQLVAQQAFMPLDDVVPAGYYDRLPAFPMAIVDAMTYQGRRYGFGVDYSAVHPVGFAAYNRTLLEREGLPDPYGLYKAGEWTWDAATEIARKATKDTDGDGVIDQWGIADMWPWEWIQFFYTNEARVTRFDESGRLQFTFDEPNALEALRQAYEWKQVDRVVGGNMDTFRDGKAALAFQPLFMIGYLREPMEDDYRVVPYPKGPAADDYCYPSSALISWVIPSNAENAEALVALQEFLWPIDEYDERAEEYLLNQVRDRDSFAVVLEGHEEFEGYSWMTIRLITNEMIGAVTAVMDGEKSPAEAVAEIKAACQARIDDVFNQ